MSDSNVLPQAVQSSWRSFLETYEPLRPELYRYCRQLTRSPWDAEDLAQDALSRAFVTLAKRGDEPPNPRAWLFRVASNLWIDRVRQRRHGPTQLGEEPGQEARDGRETREAAGTLLSQLSPQERAAVVLKDAFGLSLEETAETLETSLGAIKAALHRARGKLSTPGATEPDESVPAPAALDAFCAAFNAGDIDRLTALLLEGACVEVVGATTRYGKDEARRTVLWGMLFGVQRLADPEARKGLEYERFEGIRPDAPHVELRQHRGSWLLLHWYAHEDGDAVRAVTRLELVDGQVVHLRNYFYNPELLHELCTELALPVRDNGRRWWPRNP